MEKDEKIRCKNCGKEIVKKSYQHKFCSNKGRGNCKDKFHNSLKYDDYDYDMINYASAQNEMGWDGHKNSF